MILSERYGDQPIQERGRSVPYPGVPWIIQEGWRVCPAGHCGAVQLYCDCVNAIPIKCFVSHRPPSHEGGSVGRAKEKKKNEHMIAY